MLIVTSFTIDKFFEIYIFFENTFEIYKIFENTFEIHIFFEYANFSKNTAKSIHFYTLYLK